MPPAREAAHSDRTAPPMSHIRTRKHAAPTRLQPSLATATLLTGLALAGPAAATDATEAADGAKDGGSSATTLDGLEVKGVSGYKAERVASPKFTQALQDTPQTIQVITSDLFNQQGASTLTEALRNSPGVGTFYAGENGNTATGDTIYMRGFDSSSAIFVDGVRDVGSISRDVFNTDQVEVIKGPAGTDNGRTSPGGSINMVSKQAGLADFTAGMVSAGTDGQARATADWNHQLGNSSALRLNAMWQDSDVPGRDHVNNSRWGLAPSLAFGLDTDTRYVLNLLYMEQDNVPDGFVPTIGLPGWEPQPRQAALVGHPVDPENFYGTRHDHDEVTVEMATFRVEHSFSEAVTLSNIARWGRTTQDYMLTAFMTSGTNTAYTDVNDLSTYSIRRSNPTFKDQENTILTDQLNLRVDFATGAVGHSLSTGVEFTREEQENAGIGVTGGSSWPNANLYDPDWDVDGLTWAHNGADSRGRTDTLSAYAFDTLQFGPSFLVTGGIRLDRYETEYDALSTAGVVTDLEDSDTLFNWKLGAVYKVGQVVSIYADYAISQQPPGGSNFQLSSAANNANNPNMDPQKAETVEAGTKWALAGGALSLDMAIFQTDVTNEITGNAADGYFQDGRKRIKGLEVSTVGNITEAWSISAGYTRMQTRVLNGSLVTADGTYNLTYTPDEAFTSWTSYRLPFGLVLGGGVRYSGELHRGTDSAAGTPKTVKSYTVWDAVASYPIGDSFTLRLNAYNVFDKQYVAAINKSGYRYTPGTPRSFLLTGEFRF